MSAVAHPAVVFNCGYNGLSIIQDLGRRGVPCVAMDTSRSIGTYSRYARYVRCPDPSVDEKGFVEFLHAHCSGYPLKPVLFPTNDHYAMAVSRHKRRLEEVSIPCVGDWEAVRLVIDKDRFYALGQERGYRTPRTYSLDELGTLPDGAFPLAAKPKHRRVSADAGEDTFHKEMDRLRLTVIDDRSALEAFLAREARWLPHLVFQEYVPGLSNSMYTVGVYAAPGGEVRARFSGRKVRDYPADIGDCVVGENASVPDHVLDEVDRVVRELGLSGILEFEYKRHDATGELVLIEVNPRSWSWVGITSHAGADLPWTAYLDLTGRAADLPAPGPQPADGAVRYAKVVQDAINSLFRYGDDHPAWRRGPVAWWRELHGPGRVVKAEFQGDDPLVAARALVDGAKLLARWALGRARRRTDAPRSAPGAALDGGRA